MYILTLFYKTKLNAPAEPAVGQPIKQNYKHSVKELNIKPKVKKV